MTDINVNCKNNSYQSKEEKDAHLANFYQLYNTFLHQWTFSTIKSNNLTTPILLIENRKKTAYTVTKSPCDTKKKKKLTNRGVFVSVIKFLLIDRVTETVFICSSNKKYHICWSTYCNKILAKNLTSAAKRIWELQKKKVFKFEENYEFFL